MCFQITSRKKKKKNADDEDIILPDVVVGFAISDDFNDLQGTYRFTAEVEIYVDSKHYMKGIGKCLADKMLGMLDPKGWTEHGGYETYGEELEGIGHSRLIKNIIVNLPHDRPEHLEWKGRWLEGWLGFKRVGLLNGIGTKNGRR